MENEKELVFPDSPGFITLLALSLLMEGEGIYHMEFQRGPL